MWQVWSAHSVNSDWVRTEAHEGLDRGVLVPVSIDDVKPPLAFRRTQTAVLSSAPTKEELAPVLAAVTTLLRSTMATRAPDRDAAPTGLEHPLDSGIAIAVLPFQNLSSDPEQQYFVDGITEDLIDRLSRGSTLRVIARTSSFQFKNRTDDVREIGSKLGVTHLVEGAVRRAGQDVRITVQLVRTTDGWNEWSERYDRVLDDVFALQDEITKEVTSQLAERLTKPNKVYRPKPSAYDEYLRGQVWLRRIGYGEARRARSFFDSAIQLDPEYAEAYSAAAKASLMELSYNVEHDADTHERAVDYIDKALALDSGLASAIVQKAKSVAQWDFDVQKALDLIRKVLTEEPNSYEGLAAALTVYGWAGRRDLVEQAARTLIQIDPVGIGNAWLFFVLVGLGRLEEAQKVGEALLAVESDNRLALGNMADLMARQGRIDEAIAFLEKHGLQNYPQAGFVYAAAGLKRRLESVVNSMAARSGLKIWLAHGYALLGDVDQVVESVKQGIHNHDPVLAHLIGHGPFYDSVNLHGQRLETIFEGSAVQEVMRSVNLDRESTRQLRI